jgi:guanine nucleotide-binding protein G(i) subunit alpha
MADPMTILSTASSVVGIIEVLAKTMSRLRELNERWRQADFTFINLISQLSALKAALNKLREWIDADMDETHHQLILDLEVSITCCRMLIDKMDSEVSELQRSTEKGLNPLGKIKLMIKNSTLEELQKMVERQTNALTLLLTACNW